MFGTNKVNKSSDLSIFEIMEVTVTVALCCCCCCCSGGMGPAEMLQQYPNSGCQRLHITAPLGMTQSYLSRLFNLIPGLEYCDLNEQTGVAYARYQTSQCAAYAHDKLDGFEYPIGSRLIVRYADSQPPPDLASSSMSG